MKGKRGTDHNWDLVKFQYDMAIYASCKCGYHYMCSRGLRDLGKEIDGYFELTQIPTIFYPYCPCCGARKKTHSPEIKEFNSDFYRRTKWGKIYNMSGYFLEQLTRKENNNEE